MKSMHLIKTICSAVLILLYICIGNAFAESDFFEAEMELFTAGDFPEYISIQTFSENSFDRYVYEKLKNGEERIDISAFEILPEDLALTLTMVVNDHPDLFYVGTKIRYSTSEDYVKLYVPEYLFTGDELQARQADFDASIDKIVAHASRASSTIGKMLLINDYFCTNYAYDNSLTIYRPDQLFSDGTGVCQAYMLGYAAVLDKLGIANTHATSLPMQHTWNLVNLGDDWYHVDVTWNDPVPDTMLQAGHRYFLLSDNGMLDAKHHDWLSSTVAADETYDSFFWQSIYTPLAPVGSNIYYLSSTAENGMRSVMNGNASTGASRKVFDYSIVGADNKYSYAPQYGPVAADDNFIYYGARGVLWAADHNGNNPVPVYTSGNDSVHIWSCSLEDGMLYMRLKAQDGTLSVVSCPVSQRLGAIFTPAFVELLPGETVDLTITTNINASSQPVFTISSSNTNIATINAENKVTAISPGAAYITAKCDPYQESCCPVIVHAPKQIIVPAETVELKSESFLGTAVQEVILPDGLQTIGANAFSACEELILVHIPSSVENIHTSAFSENEHLTLVCTEGSVGAAFAQDQNIPIILIPAKNAE